MEIRADQRVVTDLLVFLSREEAAELRDAADQLLLHFDEPGWHAHVSNPDYSIEITIAPIPSNLD